MSLPFTSRVFPATACTEAPGDRTCQKQVVGMADNTQHNNSENGMKKWATTIEDAESQNGRTGDEFGSCETVEGDEDRAAGCRRETPQSQVFHDHPRAHHLGHDPVAIPTQLQGKAEILDGKQEDTSNRLKQEVSEQYDEMRQKLNKDEKETIEVIEENSRIAVGKLNRAIKEGNQHLEQIFKLIKSAQTELRQKWTDNTKQVAELKEHREFNKKTFAGEEFEINKSKFQKLLKLLKNISENLQAKFLQKSLLMDQTPVLLDITTSNKTIYTSGDQTGMCLVSEPQNIPNSPLRFDAMCYVLASSGWMRGKHYWEVDVQSSPAWSIGMAYGSIERKGKQKAGKLGRNRLSWCLELKDNMLLAWHNDKAILCGKGLSGMKQVGVHVDCERSKIIFYNAKNMKVLQEFSSATACFFDRLQHQFTEAVFPALGLFPPKSGPITFERLQICNSSV
ncbi:nuclear factor 7, ovary-like isoform X2 [Pleurodeles waltl]|uniref:nuclear factor 7, ovary-like isoform X2 n=1 Tax=Pleurodeles waltl TaxID=8319 RepID=UPI003709ABB4